MLYDDLIEIARDKQHKRRRSSVHKSVPCPQFVLVVGDEMTSSLEQLCQQITGRWSSGLTGLQVCYCGFQPYDGPAPVQQMVFFRRGADERKTRDVCPPSDDLLSRLEACGQQPAAAAVPQPNQAFNAGGESKTAAANALLAEPALLRQFNRLVAGMVETISRTPGLAMRQAYIHVVMQPQSGMAAVVQDLIAVVQGHLLSYGVTGSSTRIYLLLPDRITTGAAKKNICAVLDQLSAMNSQPYDRPVLLQQLDGEFQHYKTNRLVQHVMLLDEWNEKFQRCNLHGERMQLLGDLVENTNWISSAFLQTVGVQETHAGPEYWLAAAADQLCREAIQEMESSLYADPTSLQQEIQRLAEQRLQGMERIFDACCLYMPFQMAFLHRWDLDQAEEMVFGPGLEQLYQQWLKKRRFTELPESLGRLLDGICSVSVLDSLSRQLDQWADSLAGEKVPVPPVSCERLASSSVSGPDAAAQLLRRYIVQNKYMLRRSGDEKRMQMDLARLCAQACRQRAVWAERQQELLQELKRELQQVWYQLRDSFNEGQPLPVQWLGQKPGAELLYSSLAKAGEDLEACARDFLENLADRVDLNGQEVTCTGEAPLHCRRTVMLELPVEERNIREGMSAGRTLRFAALSSETYTENDANKVFLLHAARE